MKGVIFDMDGLLIDSERIGIKCEQIVLEKMNLEFNYEVIKSCIGRNNAGFRMVMMDYYGPEFPFDEFIKNYRAEIPIVMAREGLNLKKGALELIKHFKEKDFKIALGTSSREVDARHHLESLNVLQYFDEIATGDMVQNGKPAPDIFLLAAEKIGLKPSECYVFEDSYNGVRAGKAGGFYVIMVPDILEATDEMRELADEIKDSLLDFITE